MLCVKEMEEELGRLNKVIKESSKGECDAISLCQLGTEMDTIMVSILRGVDTTE